MNKKTRNIVISALLVLFTAGICLFYRIYPERLGEKYWIYENIPDLLWQEESDTLVTRELMRVADILGDYAEEAAEACSDKTQSKALDELFAASLFGLEDLYLLGGGPDSHMEKLDRQLSRYRDAVYQSVKALGLQMHEERKSLYDKELSFVTPMGDRQMFTVLIGTPDSPASPSSETVQKVARMLVTNILAGRARPAIASSQYDWKGKEWNVRMDNAPDQTVRFLKRDDGSSDITWTGSRRYVPGYVSDGGRTSAEPTQVTPEVSENEDGFVDDDELDSEPNEADTDIQLYASGYLEDDAENRYAIAFFAYITRMPEEDGRNAVTGGYRYTKNNGNTIGLEGRYDAEKELFVLISSGGTERFELVRDDEDNRVGYWYKYEDKADCEAGNGHYTKSLDVFLKEDDPA